MKRRNITEEELALWRQAMRNTAPLPGRDGEIVSTQGESESFPPASAGSTEPSLAVPPLVAVRPPSIPGGLDAAAQRRLRRGRAEVDGRVDLHGMRQAEAHAALTRFLAESQAAGRRCVLVITGKGGRPSADGDAAFMLRDGNGVLRQQVPVWLAQEPNASRIFAIEQAHPRHGGAGAFYVFLRRARGRDDHA